MTAGPGLRSWIGNCCGTGNAVNDRIPVNLDVEDPSPQLEPWPVDVADPIEDNKLQEAENTDGGSEVLRGRDGGFVREWDADRVIVPVPDQLPLPLSPPTEPPPASAPLPPLPEDRRAEAEADASTSADRGRHGWAADVCCPSASMLSGLEVDTFATEPEPPSSSHNLHVLENYPGPEAEGEVSMSLDADMLEHVATHGRRLGSCRQAEEQPLIPSCFERFFVERPVAAFLSILGLTAPLAALSVAQLGSKQLIVTSESAWDVRSDLRVQRNHAFWEAVASGEGFEDRGSPEAAGERRRLLDEITLIYQVEEGDDIFKDEYLQQILEVERTLLDSEGWSNRCQLLEGNAGEIRCSSAGSSLTLVQPGRAAEQAAQLEAGFGHCAEAREECMRPDFSMGQAPCISKAFDPILHVFRPLPAEEGFRRYVRCMCCAAEPTAEGCSELDCGPLEQRVCGKLVREHLEGVRTFHIGRDLSCSSGKATTLRSRYALGYPSAGDDTAADRFTERGKLEEWARRDLHGDLMASIASAAADTSGKLSVWLLGAGLAKEQFATWFSQDRMLILGALGSVSIWIWACTYSTLTAASFFLGILLTVPPALLCWSVACSKFVTNFMFTSLWLLLVLAADGAMAFWETYQQADMVFMLDSTMTEVKKFAWACRRARGALAATSTTAFCALVAAGISRVPDTSAFGIFAAFLVVSNFALVSTLFLSTIALYRRYFRCCADGCLQTKVAAPGQPASRRSIVFMANTWAPGVYRYRIVIFCFWGSFVFAGLVLAATLLRPADSAPRMWQTFHQQRQFELTENENLGFAQESNGYKIPLYFVFGLLSDAPIDRSSTDFLDTFWLGDPIYSADSAKILSTPAGQLRLWQLCEDARDLAEPAFLSRDDECRRRYVDGVALEEEGCQSGVTCFIDWVKDYRVKYKGSHREDNWHLEELDGLLSAPAFFAYLEHMDSVRSQHGQHSLFDRSWFYVKDSQLQWAYVSLNTTLKLEHMPLEEVRPHFDFWEQWSSGRLQALGGFQTCDMWCWMVTQAEMLTSVLRSTCACVFGAFLTFCIFTANWIVALLCLLSLLAILTVFALFLTTAGFSLGIYETVGLLLVVALSVNFTGHVAHCFNECRFVEGEAQGREAKMQHALVQRGVGIVKVAVAACVAALWLLPASSTFMVYFGVFMIVTVFISTLASLTLLPALLSTLGPSGSEGDLAWVWRCLVARVATGACSRQCCRRRSDSAEMPG
eukprot:TRINITY_DN33193_c0_g3_i2.p1 TRINITY_DN33193_c0_g3~~TRINITY_DN33193_c0_g3_i2.p1  ORF type:complete len:1235 (-),score=247.88 TRINITY_DN33193_c0_g3_i2:90-3794(-)